MKKLFSLSVIILFAVLVNAQNGMYITKTGKVSFKSTAKSPEKVEADNNDVSSIINVQTGDIVFGMPIKSFRFASALMEEHFNENYMESNKFPKSTFRGKITNLSAVTFTKDGVYPATVDGDLTIHGVTKKVSSTGSITIKAGKIATTSKFSVKLKDYGISIPSLVADKISEDIEIIVDCKFEPKS